MKRKFENVLFRPWVGDYYDESPLGVRLLILGESHYRNADDPAPEELTTINALKLGRHTHSYWRRLSALVGEHKGKYQPDVWDSVVFYNYVQHVVGNRPRQRPAPHMWTSDQTLAGFREVLRVANPQRILVVGKTNWQMIAGGSTHFPKRPPIAEQRFVVKNMGDKHFGSANDYAYWYPTTRDSYALCAPIFHPAYPQGFFSPTTKSTVKKLITGEFKMPS